MKDSDLSEIANSPARVRILEIIGEKGSASFTDIKKGSDLSTGSIYYHLSYLKDFVTRDDNRRYALTERGVRLLERMGIKTIAKEEISLMLRSLSIVTLSPILKRLTHSRWSCIVVTILALVIGSFANSYSGSNQFLLSVPGKYIMNPILSTLMTGWLVSFVLAEVYSLVVTRMKFGGEFELAATIALSFVPLYLYSSISYLQMSRIILIPMQVWSAILLAGGLNISKGIKLTYSLIFSLIMLYLSIYIWLTV
ncbi:MAG: DUF7347 domain-containing protein [Nitrososphaerales archaeon]